MFEAGNRPVRPPLKSPEQVAPAERPQRATAVKAPAYARRKHHAKQAPREKQVSPAFAAAKEMTTRAADDIRRQHGALTRDECLRLVSVFRTGLVPRRRAGRRPKPQVTAAYFDWKAGMRGVALFRKHIPGWDKHGEWRRKAETRALMDAIRSRYRRERRSTKEAID
jgi:hypothetical protein